MKLKYHMRGLGIGILLTTLIFALSDTEEKLTDKEIMVRARALGMVTVEESNQQLEQVLEDIKPTGLEEQPSGTPAAEPTAEPTKVPAEPTAAPTIAPTPEPTPEPTKVPDQTVEETPTNQTEDQENGAEINFTIKSGMSSGQVAALLVEIGLVDSEEEFNKYIVKVGKASVIRVGDYSLPKGASYWDIVTEITTRR